MAGRKRPAFQFYPGDWLKDPALRSVSLAARGLWMDLLCLMHESPRRGYLQHANGKPLTLEQIARMTGCSTEEASRLLRELEYSGVFSCTEHGVIYSRRMVRDEQRRLKCAEAGKKGGNPVLLRTQDKTLKGEVKGRVKGGVKPKLTPSSSSSSSTSVNHSGTNTHTLLQALEHTLGPQRARECACVLQEWFAWLEQRGKPPLDEAQQAVALAQMFPDVEQLRMAVQTAKANGWTILKTDMVASGRSPPEPSEGLLEALKPENLRRNVAKLRGEGP